MIISPIHDRFRFYLLLIVAVTILCFAAYGLVQSVQPVHAKSEPDPGECTPFVTIGAQNIFRCEDPNNDVICYVNNYSFMQCILP